MNAAIELDRVTRTFGTGKATTVAVDSLDLTVAPGELVALLGPNGAGKSTTLKMLTTLPRPTSGTVRLLGTDVVRHPAEARRHFGFVGQGNGAGNLHHGRDEVIGQALAHGFGRRAAISRADELIETLGLTEVARRPVQQLSGGQRRRFDIAIGLANRPAVLFLDEPSTGLDPQNRAHLQHLIRDLYAQTGATIVLTTHYLEEADALSQRVVIIDHGRIIADDTARRLKHELGDLVTVHLTAASAAAAAADALRRSHPDARVADATVQARVDDGPATALRMVDTLRAAGHPVTGVEVTRPSLDDVFLTLTGRSLRESSSHHSAPPQTATPQTEEVAA